MLADGVWSFALDPEQEKQVYTTAIRSLAGVSSTGSSQQLDGVRTILLDAGEGSAPDLPYTNRVQVSADEDGMKDALKELTRLLGGQVFGLFSCSDFDGFSVDSGEGASFSSEGGYYVSGDCG